MTISRIALICMKFYKYKIVYKTIQYENSFKNFGFLNNRWYYHLKSDLLKEMIGCFMPIF